MPFLYRIMLIIITDQKKAEKNRKAGVSSQTGN